jgi:hypothetical protein
VGWSTGPLKTLSVGIRGKAVRRMVLSNVGKAVMVVVTEGDMMIEVVDTGVWSCECVYLGIMTFVKAT